MDLVNLSEQARIVWRLARSRPIDVRISGGEEARKAFEYYTRAHRFSPFASNMTFGVALMELPRAGGLAFAGTAFQNFRRRRKRALDRGYTFAPFEGAAQVERILAIHRSAPTRQGQPMSEAYQDALSVRRYSEKRGPFFGVFDSGAVLRAYCHAPTIGEVLRLVRIIGEHNRLDDGIMYLLLWETAVAAAGGGPRWVEYGSYVGGGRGLRTFKKECGFRPYRVNWIWQDAAP